MMYSNELIEKAKNSKTAEELLEMAKTENIELSAEEAAKAFAQLHKKGELSDDELDNVAGGCSEESARGACNTPEEVKWLYKIGQKVEVFRHVFGITDTYEIVGYKVGDYDGKRYYPVYIMKSPDGGNRTFEVLQEDIKVPGT